MTMKTTDMETIYDLGQKMIDALIKEKVTAGSADLPLLLYSITSFIILSLFAIIFDIG